MNGLAVTLYLCILPLWINYYIVYLHIQAWRIICHKVCGLSGYFTDNSTTFCDVHSWPPCNQKTAVCCLKQTTTPFTWITRKNWLSPNTLEIRFAWYDPGNQTGRPNHILKLPGLVYTRWCNIIFVVHVSKSLRSPGIHPVLVYQDPFILKLYNIFSPFIPCTIIQVDSTRLSHI